LIRLSANARSCLGNEASALRRRLDIPARVRSSLAAHPTSWLFGSLASGLAASLLFRRRPVAKIQRKGRGLLGVILGLTLTAARPLAKIWLTQQLARWASQAAITTPPGRPVPRPLPRSQFL